MSKKHSIVISYANRRILLETIASYWPWVSTDKFDKTSYGIAYSLRSGEKIDASGNDETSRDKAIKFLDEYFSPDVFTGQKCAVCANKSKACASNNGCYSYNSFKAFVRIKEAAAY